MSCAKQYSERAESCQPPLRRWVDRSRRWLAQTLWPPSCILCGGGGDVGIDLCRDCAADLPRNETACVGLRGTAAGDGAPQVCGDCLRDPPPFGSSFVPFRYAYPLDHLVHGLKFRNELACGSVLGQLFARCLLARGEPLPDAIVPVPLAPRRYRQRGYNQASELALAIRRITGIAIDVRCCDPPARDCGTGGARSQGSAAQCERRVRRSGAAARASRCDPRRRRHNRQHRARARRSSAASRSGAGCRVGDSANGSYGLKRYSSAMPMNTDMPK